MWLLLLWLLLLCLWLLLWLVVVPNCRFLTSGCCGAGDGSDSGLMMVMVRMLVLLLLCRVVRGSLLLQATGETGVCTTRCQ